jgi:hypothetical protein
MSSFLNSTIVTISQSFGNGPMNNSQQQLLLVVSVALELSIENDNDVVAYGPQFQSGYNQIVEVFNSGQCVMVLIKNIAISQTKDRYLCGESSIIISTVVANFVQMQLHTIHNKMCSKSQTSNV